MTCYDTLPRPHGALRSRLSSAPVAFSHGSGGITVASLGPDSVRLHHHGTPLQDLQAAMNGERYERIGRDLDARRDWVMIALVALAVLLVVLRLGFGHPRVIPPVGVALVSAILLVGAFCRWGYVAGPQYESELVTSQGRIRRSELDDDELEVVGRYIAAHGTQFFGYQLLRSEDAAPLLTFIDAARLCHQLNGPSHDWAPGLRTGLLADAQIAARQALEAITATSTASHPALDRWDRSRGSQVELITDPVVLHALTNRGAHR